MFDKQQGAAWYLEEDSVIESCLLDCDGHFQDAVRVGGDLPSRSQSWCPDSADADGRVDIITDPSVNVQSVLIYLSRYPDV